MDDIQMARSPRDVHRVVTQWERAGRALSDVRRAEVAALTDERAAAATLDLLATVDLLGELPLRTGSGLVEQQRWFARLRHP